MDKLQLEIPEGMCIDIENSDLNKGVIKLKAKDEQKKWEDFGKVEGYYIGGNCDINKYKNDHSRITNKNVLPTKSLANAMLALCQLFQWRNKVWKEDGNWKPEKGYAHSAIYSTNEGIHIEYKTHEPYILSFSTEEVAKQFFKYHRDLIETAKEVL